MKLSVQGIGLAFGGVWGIGALLLGLSASFFGYGTEFVELVGKLYIGYTPTPGGAFIGAIWGFVDAYIGGIIFAWIYNRTVSRAPRDEE